MINLRLIILFVLLTNILYANAQDSNGLKSEVCLSVIYKDLGFTKSFESNKELGEFLFTHELLLEDPAVRSVRFYEKEEINQEYVGVEKYCNRLLVLKIKKRSFDTLNESIKQRLSGI